jgi:hypothetical protein
LTLIVGIIAHVHNEEVVAAATKAPPGEVCTPRARMRLSYFLRSWLQTALLRLVRRGISRFPGNELPYMPGFFDHAGPSRRSRSCARSCCLPFSQRRRHPGYQSLQGSMAGLCAPLPTLRRRPHGRLRTAWGRSGSLLRHRVGLTPTTRCRSPGALPKIVNTTDLSIYSSCGWVRTPWDIYRGFWSSDSFYAR